MMRSEIMQRIGDKPIVFFDGECVLCDRFASKLLKRDKSHKLFLASLQGQAASQLLDRLAEQPEAWSIILWTKQKEFRQSTAVLKIYTALGWPYKLMGIFFAVPASIRDAVYRWVARRRYRWFGKRSSCRIPTEKEKSVFLP